MRVRIVIVPLLLLVLAWAAPAWADGTQYNGTCTGIAWNANTEPDLAGYRLYDRVSTSLPKTLIRTYGVQITSATCASIGLNAGQHYFSLTAYDLSGNEGTATAEAPFVIVAQNQIADLRVTIVNATDVTIAYTEVDDGTGQPAKMDIRFATPTISWGTAASVTSGTCSSAVAGTTIGATKTCTVTGLSLTTPYQFQGVPYRGTLGVDAVYGPLTNITDATTGGSPPSTGRVTLYGDGFNYADGALPSPWQGGYVGSTCCADLQVVSTAARAVNTGSDHQMTYAGIALPNDAWVEVTLKTLTGSGAYYPRILLAYTDPPTRSGYEFSMIRGNATAKSQIARWINGVWTSLSTENATTWTGLDVARWERHGNEMTIYKNDVLISALTVSDATFASGGRGGLLIYVSGAGSVANAEFESISMGTFGTASTDTCGCDNN